MTSDIMDALEERRNFVELLALVLEERRDRGKD